MRRRIITAIILAVPFILVGSFILSNFKFTPPWHPKSAEEYAKKYELINFSGIDINKENPTKVDIYGTIRRIDIRSLKLKLALVVPGYLRDYARSKYYIPQDSDPRMLTINLDENSKFYDPNDNNQPKDIRMIAAGNGSIIKTFTNAYVHIDAIVADNGNLIVRQVSIAIIPQGEQGEQ
mgnify:FL=1